MERFGEKVIRLLDGQDANQARAARSIRVDPSQFAKWLKGKGRPTVEQLCGLARFLGTSMEFLADDALVDPPAAEGLTEDERLVLDLYHASGLNRREVIDLFMRARSRKEERSAGVARPVVLEDLEGTPGAVER